MVKATTLQQQKYHDTRTYTYIHIYTQLRYIPYAWPRHNGRDITRIYIDYHIDYYIDYYTDYGIDIYHMYVMHGPGKTTTLQKIPLLYTQITT